MLRLFVPFLVGTRQLVMRTVLTLLILGVDLATVSLVPSMTKSIVTALSGGSPSMLALTPLLVGFTFFLVLSHITSYLMEMAFFPVINEAIKRLTARSVERMHSMSLLHNQRLDSAEVLSATSRIGMGARVFFKAICLSVVLTMAKLLLALALVWDLPGINVCLMVSMALGVAVAVLIPRYVQARKRAWAFTDARAVKMIDSLLNTKVVRFSFEPEMAKLNHYLEREALGWQTVVNHSSALGISMALVFGLSLGGTLYLAVGLEMYPVTEFVYLKTLLIGVFMQVRHTVLDLKHLLECYTDIERILKLLDPSVSATEQQVIQPLFSSSSEAILCRDVSFAYPAGQLVLNELNLTVEHNRKVAIVGANGCGKSTLLHLLSGLYLPQVGEVVVAGLPAVQMSQQSLSVGFCFLPQDVFLFHGTFYENLVYGVDHPSTDRVAQAISHANLDGVVERLPQGLHTPLGEFGKVLSGGEKQRLALARAMLLKPRILILDESLNSVDVNTEKQLLAALCEQIPTVIMVSHRESVLSYCDQLYQLEGGRLTALGGTASLDLVSGVVA